MCQLILLLKDNADDIKEKVEGFKVHAVIKKIMQECEAITNKYASVNHTAAPEKLTYV